MDLTMMSQNKRLYKTMCFDINYSKKAVLTLILLQFLKLVEN